MKLILDIEDIKLLDSALSHAIKSYADIVSAEFLGCQIPLAFEQYFEKHNIKVDERYEHLLKRINTLKDLEKQIEEAIINDTREESNKKGTN